MEKLELYEKFRKVPDNAKKPITAGRLKGYTDINPMFRIKTLTETYGPCGIGWYYEIEREWLETGANDTIAAFVKIALYVKNDNEWSKPIIGVGGSMFVANEKNGLYTSDEAYKMALTDAISVSCKSLGMGADVYWEKDRTKYSASVTEAKEQQEALEAKELKKISEENAKETAMAIKEAQDSFGDIVSGVAIANEKQITKIKELLFALGQPEDKVLNAKKMKSFNEFTEVAAENFIRKLEERLNEAV